MFKRFSSRKVVLEQVVNATYRNSRILVLMQRNEVLPFEIQVDLVRHTIRFKTSEEAMTHAQKLVDTARQALLEEKEQGHAESEGVFALA
jgi:hypothetical protein